MNPTPIIALWYEPGTAQDAATAAYHRNGRRKYISADSVRSLWAKAQEDGRLPPSYFVRPLNGWGESQSLILKAFMGVERGRVAA